LLDSSKEVGLEVSREKMKYVVMSGHQNARQSHSLTKMWHISNMWEQQQEIKIAFTVKLRTG